MDENIHKMTRTKTPVRLRNYKVSMNYGNECHD